MDYIRPAECKAEDFRGMWAEFEWENKVYHFYILALSSLILSCVLLSYLILPNFVFICLIVSYFILSCFILSYFILSCFILSYFILSCFILSYLALFYLVWFCLYLYLFFLSCFILSNFRQIELQHVYWIVNLSFFKTEMFRRVAYLPLNTLHLTSVYFPPIFL